MEDRGVLLRRAVAEGIRGLNRGQFPAANAGSWLFAHVRETVPDATQVEVGTAATHFLDLEERC
jgi:hypothetical protein